jgi:transcriptional regulator with XRE-family HTH domain
MRESFGLTQDQLAAKTEGLDWPVSRATISALEKGKHSPSAVTILALTTVLHVDPMEIFDRLKMATPVPPEYRKLSVEQLDARFLELFGSGQFREALTTLDTIMSRLVESELDDPATKCRQMALAEVRRATTLRRLGALVAAKESAERATLLSTEHPALMAAAYQVLVAVHLRRGYLQLGLDAAERAVELAASGGAALMGQALVEKGRALLEARRFEDAYRVFTEARDRLLEAGDDVHVLTATGNMGVSLAHLGKRSEAESRIRSAVDLAQKLRRPDLEARWLLELGRVAYEGGHLEGAGRLANDALLIAQRGEYWQVAFGAAMLLHRLAKVADPKTPDRHRMAYLKKLRSWVDEDVSDADFREFLDETRAIADGREGEA